MLRPTPYWKKPAFWVGLAVIMASLIAPAAALLT